MSSYKPSHSKKFSFGPSPNQFHTPSVPAVSDIEKQVSVIEIGAQQNSVCIEISKKHKRSVKFFLPAALLSAACLMSVIAFAFVPLPKSLKSMLMPLAEYIIVTSSAQDEHPALLSNMQVTDYCTPVLYNTENSSDNADIPAPPQAETEDSPYFPQQDTSTSLPSDMNAISNETAYNVSLDGILKNSYPISTLRRTSAQSDETVAVFAQCPPEVLIIHTHGTESYAGSSDNDYRSENTQNNVVRVGRELCDTLQSCGISAIHCEEMFDKDSYIKAYSNSREAVSEYLSKYPSIKYVIDLHRDAVCDKNGVYSRLVTQIDSYAAAKLMLVIGTDEAGAVHRNWQKNLRTAAGIQQAVCSKYPGLMRNINLRRASFNQQLCDGYFILEAGNCGNTLDEVLIAVRAFGQVFAEIAAPQI